MALPNGVPAAGRYSIRKIAEIFAVARAANAGSAIKLDLLSDGKDKSLRVTAQAVITVGADHATLDVADSGGARRGFAAVDDAVKALATEAGLTGLDVNVAVGTLWDTALPTDLIAAKKKRRTKITDLRTKAQAKHDTLTQEIALMAGWENGTTAQKARKLEAQTQLASLTADIASYTTEIDAITAAVGA